MSASASVDMDVDCRRPRHDENHSSLFVENSSGDLIETCASHAPGVRGFCQCISLTLKLVWCKTLKTMNSVQKIPKSGIFLYGISFILLSENNSFLHGKISCFCIFFRKNSVFNTNRTPRVTLHQLRLAACSR